MFLWKRNVNSVLLFDVYIVDSWGYRYYCSRVPRRRKNRLFIYMSVFIFMNNVHRSVCSMLVCLVGFLSVRPSVCLSVYVPVCVGGLFEFCSFL